MKYLYIYKSIAIPSIFITLFECYQFWMLGSGHGIVFLIWEKLITLAALSAYVYFFKSKYTYFFMNLGTSKSSFYFAIVALDLIFFCIALTFTAVIK